jgi:hypothetical protein
VEAKELRLGLRDPRQRPPEHPRGLKGQARRPDLAELLELDEDPRFLLGEGRLVRAGRRQARGVHDQGDLLGRQAPASLDLGRADRPLGASRIQDGIEDRVLEPSSLASPPDRIRRDAQLEQRRDRLELVGFSPYLACDLARALLLLGRGPLLDGQK